MNIAFYLTGSDERAFHLAEVMMCSARRHMSTTITQLTDMDTRATTANGVKRFPAMPLNLLRSKHYSELSGEWLLVDTDVYFQRDVGYVFSEPFDVAIADRAAHVVSEKFAADMPYNSGVVFSRCPSFWRDVHRMCLRYLRYQDAWFGDQRAICDLIASEKYRALILHGAHYNYPPEDNDDRAEHAAIVHCKGNRKDWMLARA